MGRGSDVRPGDVVAFDQARRRAGELAKRRRDFAQFLMAEIAEGESCLEPRWYALTITPGYERIAAAHLAARRFGVYLPIVTEVYIERGCYRARLRLIMPSYLFIASLGLVGRWRRPLHVPGVTGYVYRSGADRTCDEPAPIPQRFIDQVRAEEEFENARAQVMIRRPEDAQEFRARKSRAGSRRARARQKARDKAIRRAARERLP